VATRVTRVANSDKKAKPFNAILPTSEPDMDSNQNSWTAHGVGACRILVVTRSRQGGDVDPKRAKAQLRCFVGELACLIPPTLGV